MIKKKRFLICIAALLLVCALVSCASPESGVVQESQQPAVSAQSTEPLPTEPPAPEENASTYAVDWQVVKIPAPSLSNNLIKEPDNREISVLLPPGYRESTENYPVLYFLNGYGGSHRNTAKQLQDAMTALELEELIVVSVDAISRLDCSFYVNSPVTGNWQDFVTNDVVKYIDASYRTVANAQGRGLAGHSIGGFGVLNIALNTEGIYDYVYAMSPAVFAPDGFVDYDLHFNPVTWSIEEYQDLSKQEASAKYEKKLSSESWKPRYAFDYGSAFVPDAEGNAPYILLPERLENGEYQRDDIWEQYQNGLGGPTQQLEEKRERLLKLKGLAVDYGRQDESVWILNGCKYLEQRLGELEIPVDMRVYDGDHSSKVPKRFISDVLPYFAEKLAK